MPQENLPETSPSPDQKNPSPEPASNAQWFIAAPDGQVFVNSQKLPAESLLNSEQFKAYKKLMRFAFDQASNTVFIQDGKEWHASISAGDEEAWKTLNVALWFIRKNFGSQPKLRYGLPPGSSAARSLSQYEIAWDNIKDYLRNEFDIDAQDLAVFEYVPTKPDSKTVEFGGDHDGGPPAFRINLNMDPYGRPDYDKINRLLTQEYLNNLDKIHADEWDKHVKGEDELYFAIWHNGKTRVFKANQLQKNRLLDEDTLRSEPSLKGYDGPILMFSYEPKSGQILLHNSHHQKLAKSDFLQRMFDEIKRKVAKRNGASESNIILGHNDMSSKPFVTKLSKQAILWDFIKEALAPEAGIEAADINVVEAPLTKDGSVKALLVKGIEDEKKIPVELAMRTKHGVAASYPFIAVESRISSLGIKLHEILREYAQLHQALQTLPIIEFNFQDNVEEQGKKFVDYVHGEDDIEALVSYMQYMFEMGMDKKAVLDFFCPRKNALQRAFYIRMVQKAVNAFRRDKAERRNAEPAVRTAALNLGINDWYFVTLQEDINKVQHVNDKQGDPVGKDIKPFNLKQRREQFSTGPNTTEGLLNKKHDKELGYMKSTEQLLRESQI